MRNRDAARLGILPDADFFRARAAVCRHQADAAARGSERDRLRMLAREMEARAAAEEESAQRSRTG
jgi:hypothetical protein